jgi:hypothetical protein
MAYDYKDMSLDDLEQIVSNKRKAQNIFTGTQKWDSPDQLKLKESNGALRNKYGIVGDDLNLQAAEALLKQKQDASKPINQTGLPTKQTTVYETPFTNPLIAGVQGRQDILFGDGMKNVMDNPAISAIRGENEKAGENAYNSAIGNMSEFTGGRLNSWAAKAASDSKQAYADKGDADVANYVQMLLNGQKSFTDDAFNYDTGFYNRDYQERQTPILNEQKNKQLAIDEILAKGNIANDRLSAGAAASNAATNAAQLAWDKDPNNPTNILKVSQSQKSDTSGNTNVAKMTSWIYGAKSNEEALARLKQNKSLVLQQLQESGYNPTDALQYYNSIAADLSGTGDTDFK